MALEITAENFDEKLGEREITMVDFHAPWCGPCRMLGPIVDSLSTRNTNDNISIVKMNIDSGTNQSVARKYNVRNIPAILFFKNGEVVDRMVGVQSLVALEDKLKSLTHNNETEL